MDNNTEMYKVVENLLKQGNLGLLFDKLSIPLKVICFMYLHDSLNKLEKIFIDETHNKYRKQRQKNINLCRFYCHICNRAFCSNGALNKHFESITHKTLFKYRRSETS